MTPATASATTSLLFTLLVLAMAVLFMAALRRAFGAGLLRVRFGVGVLLVTLLVPGYLARAGLLQQYSPLPATALAPVLAAFVATLALALSGFGARFATAIPLAWLVGFQAFRIPVEWLLHRLYLEGVIPVQMTYAGLNFDIVSGVTGLLLGVWIAVGRPPRTVILLWNILGLVLLANIVTIAVLATPVPFRQITDGPPNLLPGTFPFVWLPTFLVQAALFGHLVVFRALRHYKPT